MLEGGCSSKRHLVSTAAVPASSQPVTSTLQPPTQHFTSSSQPTPFFTTAAYQSSCTAIPPVSNISDKSRSMEILDARPNPRFASHLHPIYTKQLAYEYELRERQRSDDADRIASSKRAKEEVTVFSWSSNNDQPSMRVFQTGFTWPYFVLTTAILSSIGLSGACERQDLQIYEEEFDTWVSVDQGHTIEAREGQRIFAKDRLVNDCPGLKKHLKAPARVAHLCYGLASERSFVREAFKDQAQSILPPMLLLSSPKHERSSSPSPLTFPSSPLPQPSELIPIHHGTLEDPIIVNDASEKQWPGDFYVCDVVACFRDCKTRVRGRHAHTSKAIFNEHFPGARFCSSTYYDQKKLWRNTPAVLRDQFIAAGRVKSALWSAFSRRIRTDGKKRAALRLCSPIELSDSEQ